MGEMGGETSGGEGKRRGGKREGTSGTELLEEIEVGFVLLQSSQIDNMRMLSQILKDENLRREREGKEVMGKAQRCRNEADRIMRETGGRMKLRI